MKSRWSDQDADALVAGYAAQGISDDLALRVYTSHLLGRDPSLVLHGGGNTSVKTIANDLLGQTADVLCVKGSGWNLDGIEPQGLPAVRLQPLLELLALDTLADADMINVQRCNLLDSAAPNPSVETLLHAFLPQKFIDHTHANAVLALGDQPDGAARCAEVFGDRMGLVPYIMPGFALARKAYEVFTTNTDVEGLILLRHGIFTFGESAREAYERMIEMVSLAEQALSTGKAKPFAGVTLPNTVATVAQVAPILRGLTAIRSTKLDVDPGRWILDFRNSPEVLDYVSGADIARYSQVGPVTPDHVIRTKPFPLVVPAPEAHDLDGFKIKCAAAIDQFVEQYGDYFKRNNARVAHCKTALDPMPRVILVPGLGLFGLGRSSKDAGIAADLAETTVRVITKAEGIGNFQSISDRELFEIEYWSLEQAKLGKVTEPHLGGQIVIVTGGAGGIGLATARAFRAAGAEVAILDRNQEAAAQAAAEIDAIAVVCDVTEPLGPSVAVDAVAEAFGGLDIVVSNAGAAWNGRIGDVSEAVLRESFELNFYGHQRIAQAAIRLMRAQETGGVLLFNASKQAVNPGPDFGPYGLPKAATLFLMKQYALDHGSDGIRANAVNADRVRSGLLTDEMITRRATARGLSDTDYVEGNLLEREVSADDVAAAFVHLALSRATTGATITVDGGNIAAALR